MFFSPVPGRLQGTKSEDALVCLFVFDQFWPFCFLRSWSIREEPLWMKSKLPRTLGLAKLWTLLKLPQAHSHHSSLSNPCHPKRAVHSSSQTWYKSTKNNTTETLEDSSSGLSSWVKDKRQECRLEVKFFNVFHSFWCDPFQRGKSILFYVEFLLPKLPCWKPRSDTFILLHFILYD